MIIKFGFNLEIFFKLGVGFWFIILVFFKLFFMYLNFGFCVYDFIVFIGLIFKDIVMLVVFWYSVIICFGFFLILVVFIVCLIEVVFLFLLLDDCLFEFLLYFVKISRKVSVIISILIILFID